MPEATAAPRTWRTARGDIRLDRRPFIVGILNVTPDSFWDGGRHAAVDAALRHAGALIDHGADMLDIGGESTRPGARPVGRSDETARVTPVIAALASRFPETPLSVDTVKADVARAALDAGAAAVNDVSGLRLDTGMGDVVAAAGAGVILMHSRGGVDRMASYADAEYDGDVADVVASELMHSVAHARSCGVDDGAIVIDPGLGFSKRAHDSQRVLRSVGRLAALGFPVMAGPSRKRFTGEHLDAADRLPGTLAACVIALLNGALLFRVHDVLEVRRALDFAADVVAA